MRNVVFAFLVFCSTSLFASANDPSKISLGEISGATASMQSLNLAEAGLDAAVRLLDWRNTEGWEVSGDNARLNVADLALGDGATGALDVLVEGWRWADPIITAEARVTPEAGQTVTKQLRLNLLRGSYFPAGIAGQCAVSLGDSSYVESYRSSEGFVGAPNYIRRDGAMVATTSVEPGALDLGNSSIWGFAMTGGGSITKGPNATVQGEDSSPLPLIDPKRVAYDFMAIFPQLSAPPSPTPPSFGPAVDIPALEKWIQENGVSRSVEDYVGSADLERGIYRTNYGTINTPTILGIPGAGSRLVVYADNIDLQGDLRIVGPVTLVVTGDIVFSGGGQLQLGFDPMNKERAFLVVYAFGDVFFGGSGGLQNRTRFPNNLGILGMGLEASQCTHSQTFTLGGNASWEAVVYAPNADITLNGGGSSGIMAGAVVGMSVGLNPGSRFYSDEETVDFFRGFGWAVAPGSWDTLGLTAADGAAGVAPQPSPAELTELEFHLRFSNTRSVPPDWDIPARWSVSAEIHTTDPAWEAQVIVSSPGKQIQGFLNHPEGLDSRSIIFDKVESMVAGISGTWTIDIDPEGEEPRRYSFTVDAADLVESHFAHFGIHSPSPGQVLVADEVQIVWWKPAPGTWDGVEYGLYQLSPYGVEFSGEVAIDTTSVTLPDLPKPGLKRLTVIYKKEGGGIPGMEVGTPYDGSGPAPFAWQVGTHTSLSRNSVDFSVISRFQRWLAGYLSQQERNDPATGGLLASPRGDGLTNLEKYALGIPPLAYDPSRLPAFGIGRGEEPGEPDSLTLTFRIVADDPALSYAVGVSSDLGLWLYSDAPESEVETDVVDNGDGTLTVTARVPKRVGEDRDFMRLLLRYD